MQSKHGLATPFSSTTPYLASALGAHKFEEETRVDLLSRLAAGEGGRRVPLTAVHSLNPFPFRSFWGPCLFVYLTICKQRMRQRKLPLGPKTGKPEEPTTARYRKAHMDDEEAGLSTLCRRSNHALLAPRGRAPHLAAPVIRFAYTILSRTSTDI